MQHFYIRSPYMRMALRLLVVFLSEAPVSDGQVSEVRDVQR